MGNRPTIADLARKAGVSVATVDRVLNGRLPVREDTAKRVYEAASAIGFHAASLIRQRIAADLPVVRFGFLLQRQEQAFYQNFAAEIVKAVESTPGIRGSAVIRYVSEQTPDHYLGGLETLGQNCDAIALTSLDHHTITKAVEKLKLRRKPVFSLLSDFAQGVREGYVGLNNMKVGRTAAWLISKMAHKPGKVAIFVGSHRWHGHELRETGFRSHFREHAPSFQVLDTLVNLETPQVTHEATLNLLERHADIAGFYVAGGGMEGALTALRAEPQIRAPIVVVNEITPDTIGALHDHLITAVIATPLASLCRTLLDQMLRSVRNGPSETPGQLFLPFNLYIPESV